MGSKNLFRGLFILSMAAIIVLLGVEVLPARAQCGSPEPSSCIACHAQEDPVNDRGEWHIIHASKDICLNCHGGNGTVMDEDLAHVGLVAQPLSDIYTDCHSCHPDYTERAAGFAATLQMTPLGCATPTSAVLGNVTGGSSAGGIDMSPGIPTVGQGSAVLLSVIGGLAALGFFFAGLGWLDRNRSDG